MPERTTDTSAANDLATNDLAKCLSAVAAHQDRRAFRTLFDHFAPRVRAYGMRLGCTPQQAEELAQETMVKVWRKAGLFDPAKAAPSTWIFRIARNQRIDAFRRESHPEFDPNDPGLVPDEEIPADQLIEQRQSGEALRLMLETLPEEQKLLLHMSFYQDMSHSHIADKLNLPLGTVKSRLRLAMGKLKTRLTEPHAISTEEFDT
ncbi:MAG: sigma-70 family RNA polymerase sigma factor [Parvibaculum sp.]|nr:sigma-70 family RNA polymerase sigma factor [Parvibaculum sp.]|tara:strand:- start:6052 stop:6666 length:615 start_codon:yes stop_codon:yes gene_type:complete